jgi:hypothetical protein
MYSQVKATELAVVMVATTVAAAVAVAVAVVAMKCQYMQCHLKSRPCVMHCAKVRGTRCKIDCSVCRVDVVCVGVVDVHVSIVWCCGVK